MTDKALLELAAKAAGIEGEWSRWHQSYGDLWVEGVNTGGPILWNPLADDADALRLAVKLRIDVLFWGLELINAVKGDDLQEEPYGEDPYAATRRAIVRAASEIGRGME